MAHGSTHGGVLAVASPKPRMSVAGLMELLDRVDGPPLLLLLEGVDDVEDQRIVWQSIADHLLEGVGAVGERQPLLDVRPVVLPGTRGQPGHSRRFAIQGRP